MFNIWVAFWSMAFMPVYNDRIHYRPGHSGDTTVDTVHGDSAIGHNQVRLGLAKWQVQYIREFSAEEPSFIFPSAIWKIPKFV